MWSAVDEKMASRARSDEAERAPGVGDVVLILGLLSQLQSGQGGRQSLFILPLPPEALGEVTVNHREREVAGGARERDGLPQVRLSSRVLFEPYLRAREIAERRQLPRPLAYLAKDFERLGVAPHGLLVVRVEVRDDEEVVEHEAEVAHTAQLFQKCERLLEALLRFLKTTRNLVRHS